MSEKVYFEQGGVRVTNARFVVRGATYPIQSIASVRATESKPIPLTAIILVLVGLGFCLGGDATWFMAGPVAIVLGVVWIVKKSKVYAVELQTSSGASQVLESKDKAQVLAIVEALNQSIIDRG